MHFKEFLLERRAMILDNLKGAVVSAETKTNRWVKKMPIDPFTNPMVYNLHTELESLTDYLLGGDVDPTAPLDGILRIKAVQEESPSQAISFIFAVKNPLREAVRKAGLEEKFARDLGAFESGIDELALRGFDIYMSCREHLFQIKIDEFKRNNYADFDESLSCSSKTVQEHHGDQELIGINGTGQG